VAYSARTALWWGRAALGLYGHPHSGAFSSWRMKRITVVEEVKEVQDESILVFSYLSFKDIFVFFSGLWRCRTTVLGWNKNLSY